MRVEEAYGDGADEEAPRCEVEMLGRCMLLQFLALERVS